MARFEITSSRDAKGPAAGSQHASTERLVHVIDDDAGVRSAVAFVLDLAGHTTQTYDSAEAFLDACADGLAGCVLTDVCLPGLDGLELVHRLQLLGLNLPIIVMTGHGDIPLAVEAMKAGVSDFIEKPFTDSCLLQAVDKALELGDRAAREQAERLRFKAILAALSPRETDVLNGLLEGKANKVIARDLGISPRTIEVYRAHLMNKTQATGLSDLVRIALLADFRP